MRAAILANGRPAEGRRLARRIRSADLIICADGGLRMARRLGVAPQVAIGDFDSAPMRWRSWATSVGAAVVRHPAEKDKTDAELALDYAVARGATEVELFGALGGRLDHLLANVALLLNAADRKVRARIVDGVVEAFLARPGVPLTARRGDLVSLLPLTSVTAGVSTRGLKYPLRNATLTQGSSLGVSNVVVSIPASVSAPRGRLLVVVIHQR